MKNLTLWGAAACAALALTACGGDKAGDKNANTVPAAVSDSLSTQYGLMIGGYMNTELAEYQKNTGSDYDTQAFYEGMKCVIERARNEQFIAGVGAGMHIMQDIKNLEDLGVNVDRRRLLKAIHDALMADSLDQKTLVAATEYYDTQVAQLQKAKQQADLDALQQSPEVVKNVKTAQAFIDKECAADPEIKKSPSGLYYKVIEPGTGEKVQAVDRAMVTYRGSHLDGRTFDEGNTAMIPGNGLIAGFAEGLMMLGKGGKIILWVPADLGYGTAGVPEAGIAPGEMLRFELEVGDIEPGVLPG